MAKKKEESNAATVERFERALRTALSTPPEAPRKAKKKAKKRKRR